MNKKQISIFFVVSVVFLLVMVMSTLAATFIPFDKRPHALDIIFEIFSFIALAIIALCLVATIKNKEFRIMHSATLSLWFIIFIISFMLSDHLMYP